MVLFGLHSRHIYKLGKTSTVTNIVKMVNKVVFVLGGPGAGKGTQCEKITQTFGFKHLSAGDLLREERAKPGSQYGKLIDDYIKNGDIVPVDITLSLLQRSMNESENDKFLIDGFPRNKENLEGWNKTVSSDVKLLFVLFFECSLETCIERCLVRGAAGSGRTDDNEESLKKRIDTYIKHSKPIIDYYNENNLVRKIDASKSPDEVFEDVKKVFLEIDSTGDN